MSNIIFGSKRPAAAPKIIINQSTKKIRKKRSDAKKDVKFKLSLEDKKILQYEAMKHNLSLTAFCSMIAKHEIDKPYDYDDYYYDDNGEFVHAELEQDYFGEVQRLKIEWNMPSYRKVVHRLIKGYLDRISGIKIYSYREGRI